MKTVKEVADLTGISVRMLHYYDKIGLFKPSKVNEAGYRFYDEESLETLQQILFFKELDIPLKEIREIMINPYFDKMKALENQKKLLIIKRNRLNGLIELIEKTLKGENSMDFKQFDMTEYYKVWEEYKNENLDKVIESFGSMDKFEEMIEGIKDNEKEIAQNAIKVYGSIEKCAEFMRKDLHNIKLNNIGEECRRFKKDSIEGKNPELRELYKKISLNIYSKPSSNELQKVAKDITDLVKEDYACFSGEKGDDRWYNMCKSFKSDTEMIEGIDKLYGKGSAIFIYRVFSIYLKDKKPKLDRLYDKLASQLDKNPTSKEVQEIVDEIAKTTKNNNEFLKGHTGINYKAFLGNMADIYFKAASKENNLIDKKYIKGTAKFIGEALKYYSEN